MDHDTTSSVIGRYSMTDIEILREASPIEDIAGQYTQLHKDGNRLSGLCPLHSETHPSFKVYPETQSCYCFGWRRILVEAKTAGDSERAEYAEWMLKDILEADDEW